MKIVDINGTTIRSDSSVLNTVPIETLESNRLKPRQTGTGAMRGQQTIISNTKAKLVSGNVPDTQDAFGQTFYDSAGTRRMLFGNYPDGNVKAKLSQLGVDVLTATDDQLIWSSDFKNFKIVDDDTMTITVPNPHAADYTVTLDAPLPEDIDYIPGYIAFLTPPAVFGTGYRSLPFIVKSSSGGTISVLATADVYVNETNFTMELLIGAANAYPGDWTVKYYLLRETAA